MGVQDGEAVNTLYEGFVVDFPSMTDVEQYYNL